MSHLYPRPEALKASVYSPIESTMSKPTPYQARPELFSVYSVVEDAKGKAHKLSAEATREFEKASSAAQAKAGKIELYSGKYYAACTFGGLMACVSVPRQFKLNQC
jgi:solute carrier family 25 phosphate transporter 3